MRILFAVIAVMVIFIDSPGSAQDHRDIDSILANLHTAPEVGISEGDSLQVAGACLDLGMHHIKEGNYDKALEYLKRAERLDSELGEDSALVVVYNKLALIHRFKGEYSEAISDYEAAISLADRNDDLAQAHETRLMLGIIYKLQGNHEKALEIFLGALPYY